VLQTCENLSFLAKSFAEEIGGKGKVNQFDGDFLLKLTVGTMREEDGAHTTPAHESIQLVGADAPWFCFDFPANFRASSVRCRFGFLRHAGFEKRVHLIRHLPVAFASHRNQFGPRFFGSFESLMEDCSNAKKGFRCLTHFAGQPRWWLVTLTADCENQGQTESRFHGVRDHPRPDAPVEPALDEFQFPIDGCLRNLHN